MIVQIYEQVHSLKNSGQLQDFHNFLPYTIIAGVNSFMICKNYIHSTMYHKNELTCQLT